MKEERVQDLIELHQIIETYDARTVIYHGVKSVQYPLIPKVGRVIPPGRLAHAKRTNRKSCVSSKRELFNIWTLSQRTIGTGWRSVNNMDYPHACWIGQITLWLPASLQPNPYEPFESRDMEKIIVPRDIRSSLKRTLNKYGVDTFSLFPSLDGLAAHIEWLQSKKD